ncbi:MAG: hypothetical protein AAF085_00695, partial [Planctomycetota bacterium]
MIKHVTTRLWIVFGIGCLTLCLALPASAKKGPAPELNERGEQIRQGYAAMLESLSTEIATAFPEVDAQKKDAFLKARADKGTLREPAEDAGPDAHRAYQAKKAEVEAHVLETARRLLSDVVPVLTDDKLDAKLMKVAVLRHGTPAGLAEFAQQSDEHKKLIDDLLADEALMKQVLEAGGANGGEYGEAMQVYRAILKASDKAREPGILHNLALGTALHQPWLNSNSREHDGSINATVFTDHSTPDGQVARY